MLKSNTARVSVLPMVESDTARVSVLPFAGSEFPAVFGGRSPWMWSVWELARRVSRLDSEETLPALLDERGEMNCTVPGVTPDGGPVEGRQFLNR